MHKSDVAFGIAEKAPGLAKGALWLWARTLPWFGKDPLARTDHWAIQKLVDMLQYRLPIHTRLGNGMKIKVHAHDYVGSQIIKHGYYEPEIVALFERILKPGMTFVDVGAHVGQYTLVASALVGATGKVHSFEPDPTTYSWLVSNIRRNSLKNVVDNRLALSDKPGALHFFLSNVRDIGSNSLRKPIGFSGNEVEVTCVTLDSYLAEHQVQNVGLLKIDVEGAEYAAFLGAKTLLSSPKRPPMIIEFEEERQRAFGSSCAKLRELLVGHGYRLFRLEGGKMEDYVPRQPDLPSLNILAIPNDREDLINGLQGPRAH